MSLILEALRKLERDKETPDRGLVVVSAPPWGGRAAPGWAIAAGAAAIGAAVALVVVRPAAHAPPVRPSPSIAAAPRVAPLPAGVADRRGPGAAIVPAAPPPRPPVRRAAPTPTAAETASRVVEVSGGTAADHPLSEPSLRLQAISERDGQPVAVVNESVVEVGDVVHGARVVRIGEGEVELERQRDGRRVVLRF